MIPTIKTLQTVNQESVGYILDTVQANVSQVVNKMNKIGLTDTTLVSDVEVSTRDTVVNTNLGREALGWMIVGKNSAVDVYESSSKNPAPSSTMIFKATASATVSFLFF